MPNTSDVILDTLESWGVRVVFGLPGDGINGLMEALRQRKDTIRFVLVRHEEAAAFAAAAYAKFTGQLGVCLATSGPGAIHLLNGLYDAKLDGAPVLAITGQTYSDLIGTRYQQEVNVVQLYSDVAVYNVQVNSAEHARSATDLAIRNALARRGVAHLNVPVDVQEAALTGDYSRMKVENHTSQAPVLHAVRAPAGQVQAAAYLLADAQRPVILVGQGARGAAQEVLSVAHALQAPVIKALLGKDVLPDDHPLTLGGLGMLGTAPAQRAMEEADALLLVGTGFPYLDYLPKPGQARAVQIDVDPARIGLRYSVEVGLVGDAGAVLRDLLPLLSPRQTSDWLVELQGEMREWWSLMDARAPAEATPIKPQLIAHELSRRLAPDAIVTGDAGTVTTWAARHLRLREGQRFSLSGTLASMGSALPYAIAAQVAYPDRQVVAFVGDGGLLMTGGELSTAAQHDLPIKIVVIKNGTLGMIEWEQMTFLGNPAYGTRLPPVDFVGFAASLGVKAWHVERPQDVGAVLDEALAHEGPALVEAVVDPFEPPMPPRITVDQAVKMSKALARGTPDAARIGLTLFRDKVRDLRSGD